MVIPCLESAVNITAKNNKKVSVEKNVSRPLLIFKHNAKAGGGTIIDILNEFKPNTYNERKLCNDTDDNNINNNMDISSSYLLFQESQTVPPDARIFGFVISSIREPCDHLLSLWAYGSAGHGHFHKSFEHSDSKKKLLGQDAPTFDSERDIDAFHQWLRDPQVKDIMVKRFVTNYLSTGAGNRAKHLPKHKHLHNEKISKYVKKGKLDRKKYEKHTNKNKHVEKDRLDTRMHKYEKHAKIFNQRNHNINSTEIPQNVDCWVYVDDFQQTLYTCLKEYENQGGFVNWTTPSLSQIVTDLQEKLLYDEQNNNDRRKLKIEYVHKNSVHENTQLSHHSKCSKYYDDESADFVRHGSSSFIYDMFGYDQCCGTRPNPKNQVISPPLPVQKMKEHNHNNNKLTILYDMDSSVQHYLVGLSLIFLTLFLYTLGVVKLVKRYYSYGVNRNNDIEYDQVESQEEDEL